MRTIDSIQSDCTIDTKIRLTECTRFSKILYDAMYLPIERMHVTKLDNLDNADNMNHWYHKTYRKYYQYHSMNVITNRPLSLDLATSSTHKSISQLQ